MEDLEVSVTEFSASENGPTVLFFGAVHGNEPCGTIALQRVIDEFKSGHRKLLKGRAVFVPICNPVAYKNSVRLHEENLNRVFSPTENPKSYESKLANQLCPLVEHCDIFLDLHSITSKGDSFLYLDIPTSENKSFSEILGPVISLRGWPELYARLGMESTVRDTTTYAAKFNKTALLLECGQHQDPTSVENAYTAVIHTLVWGGLVSGDISNKKLSEITVSDVFFRESTEDAFSKEWSNLEYVSKDTPIFKKKDGTNELMPYDGYLIMPTHNAVVGEDWLYLGKAES